MKKIFKLSILFVFVLIGFNWYQNHQTQVQTLSSQLNAYVIDMQIQASKLIQHLEKTNQSSRAASTSVVDSANTPIESIVQGSKLSSTYYYQFEDGIPEPARVAFQNAVGTYNNTGLVNLVPGVGTSQQNTVKFGIYHKQVGNVNQHLVELGVGGPEITKETSVLGTTYINHGTARLNADYPQSYTKSVAIHELGHVLGLDHSSDRTSIMYPYDQGLTQLSNADVNALKTIYPKDE